MIMAPLMFVSAAAAVVVAAIVYGRRAERRRAEELHAIAERLGWSHRAEVPFGTLPDLQRFELFTHGRRHRLTNVVTSPAGDPRAVLFDFTYTTGGGNSQATHRQTVFYAVSDTLQLPTFSLRPQRFFHTIGKAFGYQDIDLDAHPTFSGMYLLRGEDAGRVRVAFTPAAVDFFERHEGVCAAGTGRELLYWRPGRRVAPSEIERFVQDGMEVARRFAAREK